MRSLLRFIFKGLLPISLEKGFQKSRLSAVSSWLNLNRNTENLKRSPYQYEERFILLRFKPLWINGFSTVPVLDIDPALSGIQGWPLHRV